MKTLRPDPLAFNPEKMAEGKNHPAPISSNLRETVTKPAAGEGRFIRQSGHDRLYGHVAVEIAPNSRGAGIEIICTAPESAIPRKFILSATQGIWEGLHHGVISGHPVVDITVRIVSGSFHESDSSDLAFKMAGLFAVKAAIKQAGPIVLE